MTIDMEAARTLADIVQSVVTAGGILAAGIWTYILFVKRRERFPRALVSHQTHHYRMADGRTLLRVSAKIVNTGEVLLPMKYGRTRVQQFAPMPDHISALAAECGDADPVPAGDCELPWTVLGAREWRIGDTVGEVEPGESEALHSDFVIPSGVQKVLIYTYLTNHAKHDRQIGWSDTVAVSLTEN